MADAVCDGWTWAEDPDDGGEMKLILCELDPCHECWHHGHLYYGESDNLESRCVKWEEGGTGPPPENL